MLFRRRNASKEPKPKFTTEKRCEEEGHDCDNDYYIVNGCCHNCDKRQKMKLCKGMCAPDFHDGARFRSCCLPCPDCGMKHSVYS